MAMQYAGMSRSGTVYGYDSVTGRLRIDVEKTMNAEKLLREIHARPSWMTRVAAAVCTFAAVFIFTTHFVSGGAAALPSPSHTAIATSIISHNVDTQRCVADISTCGDLH